VKNRANLLPRKPGFQLGRFEEYYPDQEAESYVATARCSI